MFEKASRMKIRFESPKGNLSVEDLWGLPLLASNNGACLDNIARDLSKKLKESETESFVVKASKPDAVLQLKFEIVKHVIEVRLTENEVAEKAQENHLKKQKLLSILAQKEDEELLGASKEQLRAMVEAL